MPICLHNCNLRKTDFTAKEVVSDLRAINRIHMHRCRVGPLGWNPEHKYTSDLSVPEPHRQVLEAAGGLTAGK